ncbi:hypothetical protein AA313_de0200865 [Arthrobotrys entomopaga]|nr:hypothetical protein AA313_de0200865 [Arthrobotrys entomopaga]
MLHNCNVIATPIYNVVATPIHNDTRRDYSYNQLFSEVILQLSSPLGPPPSTPPTVIADPSTLQPATAPDAPPPPPVPQWYPHPQPQWQSQRRRVVVTTLIEDGYSSESNSGSDDGCDNEPDGGNHVNSRGNDDLEDYSDNGDGCDNDDSNDRSGDDDHDDLNNNNGITANFESNCDFEPNYDNCTDPTLILAANHGTTTAITTSSSAIE